MANKNSQSKVNKKTEVRANPKAGKTGYQRDQRNPSIPGTQTADKKGNIGDPNRR